MAKISEHFSLEEFTASSTAKAYRIKNLPSPGEVSNITSLVVNVLEPLRKWWGKPITIGSGFRCKTLNAKVGGVANSQHMTGEAADLCINGDKAKGWQWFEYIRDNLPFDQLIWEHNSKGSYWVHVSYSHGGKNRKQVISNLLKK